MASLKTIMKICEEKIRRLDGDVRVNEGLLLELRIRIDQCLLREDFYREKIAKNDAAIDDKKSSKKSSIYPAKRMSAKSWISLVAAIITIALTITGVSSWVSRLEERQRKTDEILLQINESLRRSAR